MRVALADDYALFRAGLRSILVDAFGAPVDIVEASDFGQLDEILASDGELDLILCDLEMPGMDPAVGVAALVARRPETPLVIVSASQDPADACRSLEQGARGYILKSDDLRILQRALDLVLAGGLYAPASVLLARYRQREQPEASDAASFDWAAAVPQLSARQRMIFECLADGKPNKTIARELGVAEGTVKAQLRSIFRKLGVRNRTQAALFSAELLGRASTAGPAGSGAAPASELPLSFQKAKGATLKVVI